MTALVARYDRHDRSRVLTQGTAQGTVVNLIHYQMRIIMPTGIRE